MPYKVIHNFVDPEDDNHVYLVGDTYPREGAETTLERATFLLGSNHAIGCPLIEEEEIMAKPIESDEPAEKPKRTTRARK